MAEDRDSLLNHYRGMRAEMAAVLAGLNDDRMVERTIDGWSVKDHLAHIAFWDDLRADEVVRISAGHGTALRMSGEQEAGLNALVHDLRQEMPLEQARWEWRHSRQRIEEAIAVAPESALEPSAYGEAGLVSTHEAQHAGWITEWRKRMGY